MKLKNIKLLVLIFLIYFALALVFFYPLFLGKVLFYGDNLTHIAGAYSFFKQEILSGRLPVWNPYILAGLPFLADISHSVFSPFNIFFLVFSDIYRAIFSSVVFLTALGGLGSYLLARSFGLKNKASFFSGLFYAFSGTTFEAVNDINSLTAISLLPFSLALSVFYYKKGGKFFWWFLVGFVVQLISGHTQYFFYATLTIFLALFYLLIINRKEKSQMILIGQKILRFFLAFLLVALISLFQLLPSIEMIRFSDRPEAVRLSNLDGFNLLALPRLIFPKIYGSFVEGNSWGPNSLPENGWGNVIGFVSLIAFFLIILGFFVNRLRKRKTLATGLFLLISLAFTLALGNQTALFGLASKLIPGFSFFRSPLRILAVYTLGVSFLAGLSWEVLEKKGWRPFNFRKWLFFILLTGLILTFFYFSQINFLADKLFFVSPYPYEKWREIIRLIFQSLIIFWFSIGAIFLLVESLVSRKQRFFLTGILLIIIELFLSIRGNLFFVPIEKLNEKSPASEFLQANLGEERFISSSDTQDYTGIFTYFNHLKTRPPFFPGSIKNQELKTWSQLSNQVKLLPADLNMVLGLPSAGGYTAIMPKKYSKMFLVKKINSINYGSFSNPILNKMAVKYFLTDLKDNPIKENNKNFKKVFTDKNRIIYQNLNSQNILSFVDKENKKIQMISKIILKKPAEYQYLVDLGEDGNLIFRVLNYPGWQVKIDDRRVPIINNNQLFLQVKASKGKHKVVYKFLPKSFFIGVVISLLSLVMVFFIKPLRSFFEKKL